MVFSGKGSGVKKKTDGERLYSLGFLDSNQTVQELCSQKGYIYRNRSSYRWQGPVTLQSGEEIVGVFGEASN